MSLLFWWPGGWAWLEVVLMFVCFVIGLAVFDVSEVCIYAHCITIVN